MTQWWQQSVEETIAAVDTDAAKGLTQQEAQQRLGKYGANQLEGKKAISPLTIFLEQFDDFIIWVLVGAALVSGFMQEWVDALAIIAIVILNAILDGADYVMLSAETAVGKYLVEAAKMMNSIIKYTENTHLNS